MQIFGAELLNPNIQAYFVQKLSPKVKLALRAYCSGAYRTQKEAAAAAGITKEYLSLLMRNPEVIAYMEDFNNQLDTAVIDKTAIIDRLSRKALVVMSNLMESDNENVSLKAATDILDRAPDTSKLHRMQVESFTLSGKDAQGLAEALVLASSMDRKFPAAAEGDYDKVGMITSGEINDSK